MIVKITNRKGLFICALHPQPKDGHYGYENKKVKGKEVEVPCRSPLETIEAIKFFSHAKYKHPELGNLLFHVANESKSASQYRQKLAQMGLTKGVSDYLCLIPKGEYPYAAIELKRERKSDSSVSKEQSEFLMQAQEQGAFAVVCYGYRAALYALEEYLKK